MGVSLVVLRRGTVSRTGGRERAGAHRVLEVAWGRKVRMMVVARSASSCSRSPSGRYASVASAHAVLLTACACLGEQQAVSISPGCCHHWHLQADVRDGHVMRSMLQGWI